MDKKTILKVFGEAFLRSLIVLMAITIVGFSVFLLLRTQKDQTTVADQPASEELVYSEEDTQEFDIVEEPTTEEPTTTEEITTEEITTEEPTTEEITTEEPVIASTDKKILVLNSTRVTGLAKAWMNKLNSAGYVNVATGNYSSGSGEQTRIYVAEEGMGTDLAEYFTDAVIEVGSLNSGIDVSTDGVEIFIVIGANDTTVQ